MNFRIVCRATTAAIAALVAEIALSAAPPAEASADSRPVRIAAPIDGHIHPAICKSPRGPLVVIYGHKNHRDLRMARSLDDGRTWTPPQPFIHTVDKTYYPGSLTALADGRLLHCWNRWSGPTVETEPRSVLYSLSSDDGVTWSEPREFPRDVNTSSVIRHPVAELAPNRWLASLSDRTLVFDPTTGKAEPLGDGRHHGLVPIVRTPRGTLVSGAGLRSTDDGATWTAVEKFPDLKTQGWRHEMLCLADGRLLASEILGPGFGGERIRYRISDDDGLTWERAFEYYAPGRPIVGRACPRTVQLDEATIGVVFYDIDKGQAGGPGLFFLRLATSRLDP